LRSAAGSVAGRSDKTYFIVQNQVNRHTLEKRFDAALAGQCREKRRLPQAGVGAGASTREAGLARPLRFSPSGRGNKKPRRSWEPLRGNQR